MGDSTPLLSICIPTYNRASYLKQALGAYVNNNAFGDDVEIVISDNASTDDTQLIGQEYASKYKSIKYYRNEENLKDSNFSLALDRASGEYIKLMNDNLIVSEDSIHYMKMILTKHIEARPLIFFTNGYLFNHKKVDEYCCNSFDDFLIHLSYAVTAIMVFGAWREQWQEVRNRLKYTKLKLNQDDWTYQLMERYGKCYLCTCHYANSIKLEANQRKGYNWFEVHIDNYYTILQPYIEKGLVSNRTLRKEKSTSLMGISGPVCWTYFYKIPKEFQFETSGASRILWKHYKRVPFFYVFILIIPFWSMIKIIRHILREYHYI